jgi:hypothetical protein
VCQGWAASGSTVTRVITMGSMGTSPCGP